MNDIDWTDHSIHGYTIHVDANAVAWTTMCRWVVYKGMPVLISAITHEPGDTCVCAFIISPGTRHGNSLFLRRVSMFNAKLSNGGY